MVGARASQVTSRRYAVSRTGLHRPGPSWATGTPGRAHLLRIARAGLRIDTRGNTAECSRRVMRFPAAARHALLRGHQPAGPDTTDVAARIAADTDNCEDERASTLYASKPWLHLVVTPLQTTCRLQGDTSSRTSKPTPQVTSQACSCVSLAGQPFGVLQQADGSVQRADGLSDTRVATSTKLAIGSQRWCGVLGLRANRPIRHG